MKWIEFDYVCWFVGTRRERTDTKQRQLGVRRYLALYSQDMGFKCHVIFAKMLRRLLDKLVGIFNKGRVSFLQ